MPSVWWRAASAASRLRRGGEGVGAAWILCYHRIGGDPKGGGTPWPVFRAHLGVLEGRAVPLADVLEGRAPPGTAAVTFDDAYASQGEAARACLAAGAPPTLFVPTGFIGNDRPFWWEGRRPEDVEAIKRALRLGAKPPDGGERPPLLDWPDLARLRNEGVRIETHGRDHRILTGCADDDVAEEVWRSVETLRDRLGVEASALAYPNGDWGDFDDRVAHIAARYGIRWGLTTVFGAARPAEPWKVRRVVVTDEPAEALATLLEDGAWADRAKRLYDLARGRTGRRRRRAT